VAMLSRAYDSNFFRRQLLVVKSPTPIRHVHRGGDIDVRGERGMTDLVIPRS